MSCPFGSEQKAILAKIANTIRHLSIDAIQKADSGHPGLPLGCAEIGAYLYGYFLRHNPKNPFWHGRDRFILSAGHGSMLLYSALHLSGFDISLDDIKDFRKLHSKTPGHPEYHLALGIEATTGPLGQGVANAVGMALGLKMLNERIAFPKFNPFGGKVVFLAGDGCIMEGISSEASSLAGHLKLDNLIGIYDANKVCLDGPLSECASENTKERYVSYGWEVVTINGHSFEEIHLAFERAKSAVRPFLIIAQTEIGKGAPTKAGTHKVHGSPLGEAEVKATKQALGLPNEEFYVPQQVTDYFKEKLKAENALEQAWNKQLEEAFQAFPEKKKLFNVMEHPPHVKALESDLASVNLKGNLSGRKASNDIVNSLAEFVPNLVGGSADLSCSDLTFLKKYPICTPGQFGGRNIKFGVREFAMCAAASGLRMTNMLLPFIGTFLAFSDYMKNAIRLAALSHYKVIYVFTHDSIFLGEDGPTHQPVEQLAGLRAIPNLSVIRPGSSCEVKMAYLAALRHNGPTAIILSRQNLPELPLTERSFESGVSCGAYIAKPESAQANFTLIATGSELHLAFEVAEALEKRGKPTRVVSMPSWDLFEAQSEAYKETVLGNEPGKKVSIEAGVSQGWHKYIGVDGIAISMESFGLSAPIADIAKEFGFTRDAILERIFAAK